MLNKSKLVAVGQHMQVYIGKLYVLCKYKSNPHKTYDWQLPYTVVGEIFVWKNVHHWVQLETPQPTICTLCWGEIPLCW